MYTSMNAKLVLMIVMAALLVPLPSSAELVRLQKYTIDTGSYILPSNYKIQEPESFGDNYYEGITWDIGKNKLSMIVIGKFSGTVDPRGLAYVLMSKDFCANSDNLTKESAYTPVEKPYPGWLTGCSAKGNGAPITVYAGALDNSTVLILGTTETPENAARILLNLRVTPTEETNNS